MEQIADNITPLERLAIMRRRVELLRQREDIRKSYGLLTYRPHDGQDRFHRAGKFKRRLVSCGNRWGKSTAGCAEDCAWLLGKRPWYVEGDPARTAGIPQRPVKGLVISTDWDKIDEIWTSKAGDKPGKIWSMLPDGFVKNTRKNHSGCIDMIECSNGSVLRFDTVKSWKADPMSSESSDYDFIHGDEPFPQGMWKSASRGLVDRGGAAWFTLTALNEPWIFGMFYPRRFNNRNFPKDYQAGEMWALRGSMHDNKYLSKEGIALFEKDLTAEERQCRLEGIPMELTGLVYKEFDWDRHVLKELPDGWSAFNNPPANWPVWIAIDVHPRVPQAVLALTVSPMGQKILFDEIFLPITVAELCPMIHNIGTAVQKGEHGITLQVKRPIVSIKCDPSAWVVDPITRSATLEQEFFAKGVFVEKASKALTQGILRTKDELKLENNIYVSPLLEETLYEFQGYRWDPKTGKPVDENDHMMENLYRLLLEEPKWMDMDMSMGKPVEDDVIDRTEIRTDDLEMEDEWKD